ncbi:MAG: ferredoxin [Mangrovibacterium sp.]
MTIKKVWIIEGCVSSGRCQAICPDVFEVPDQAVVKEDADLEANEPGIKEAAESCPVEVIKFEE